MRRGQRATPSIRCTQLVSLLCRFLVLPLEIFLLAFHSWIQSGRRDSLTPLSPCSIQVCGPFYKANDDLLWLIWCPSLLSTVTAAARPPVCPYFSPPCEVTELIISFRFMGRSRVLLVPTQPCSSVCPLSLKDTSH